MLNVGRKIVMLLGAALLLLEVVALPASAQYFRRPVSEIDPNIMLIDEAKVLGNKMTPGTIFIDQNGREFAWNDQLGKPTILVLSYYSCDGACSIINAALADLLKGTTAVTPGVDYQIVTASFDRHDNLKTTGAFAKQQAVAGNLAPHWTFATFKNEADLKAETERLGFKFFWSPEDRVFLHPGAFLFFAPDGRLVRVLYQDGLKSRDVELAILDARQGQFRPQEMIKFALSLCYSYSYHDGRYVMNIPLIVGAGALATGIALLFGAIFFYRSKNTKRTSREETYAQVS